MYIMYVLVCVCVCGVEAPANQESLSCTHPDTHPDTRPPTRTRTGTRTPTIALPLYVCLYLARYAAHTHTAEREPLHMHVLLCFLPFAFAVLAYFTLLFLLLLLLLSDWTLFCFCPQNGRCVCVCFSAFFLCL